MAIYKIVKRTMDIILALMGLAILSPLLLIIGISIIYCMGYPVLFGQERPGLNNKIFKMHKFRTMTDKKDDKGNLLANADRLTPLGSFLRTTSMDELPELYNVLKGDMSLVGPRPLLVRYLDRYTLDQARRHEVKPGITGWAQVNGRNSLSWEEKFSLDVWYVDNCSLWLDIQIIGMTIIKVFKREGISADGFTTMPEFMGGIIEQKHVQEYDLKKGTFTQAAASCEDE